MDLVFGAFDFEQNLNDQRRLFRLAFPEQIGKPTETAAFYRWKFHGAPYSPPSYEFVLNSEEKRMLGFYAALPYPYLLDGVPSRIGMVCDVMTHPESRGVGVFTRLGRYATESLELLGIPLLTGYPIRPEVLPGHLKIGWKVVLDLPIYIRPLKSRRILGKHPSAMCAPLLDVLLHMFDCRDAFGGSTMVLSVEQFLAHPGFDALIINASVGRRIVLERTRAFLSWRLAAPGASYDVVAVGDEHQMDIAAIVRVDTIEGIPCLAILDIVAGEQPVKVGSLHRGLLHYARAAGVDAIACMLTREAAVRFGFVTRALRAPRKFQLIVKALTVQSSYFYAAESWEPMWIDSDDL